MTGLRKLSAFLTHSRRKLVPSVVGLKVYSLHGKLMNIELRVLERRRLPCTLSTITHKRPKLRHPGHVTSNSSRRLNIRPKKQQGRPNHCLHHAPPLRHCAPHSVNALHAA
ncbi:hypothetical protein E2C01_016439 [Portunus trituberculatus]|uniref:Uncharacterized protein n=1 Tax=Portunus trituberculatus TaxID=210409 RepID=A0A5B7DQA0_PORTR|nr:hypothetical protein [Portunus trituberculatus]